MFARKSMPIGVLFMILVIALALLGVGYALWSETLTIQGNVSTGEVDVAFASVGDPLECVEVNGVLTCPEPDLKKNAANCTVTWLGPDNDSEGDGGADKMLVTVTGMYPGYHCKVGFEVTSIGNVPVHVWLPKPVGVIPAWVKTDFEDCYDDGVQLHAGGKTDVCTMDLHFANEDQVSENTGPITFTWTILATQFNEDPADKLPILVVSNLLQYSSTGWGGQSCPPDHPKVVGGGVSKTNVEPWVAPDFPINFVLAKPGATFDGATFPVFPHYTYGSWYSGETGIVAHNGGTDQKVYLYAYCSK